jgi:hypothetical protein
MHPAAATQSKICELGSLVLTSMVRDHGQGEKQKVERRRRSSPVAQVHTWPAWRGSARAADQARPREVFTAASPGAPHSALPPVKARAAQALEHAHHAQQSPAARHLIGELGGSRSRGGRPPQSPRGGSSR